MRKLFSIFGLVNILGMSLAFASLYIIMVQLVYDLGYNKHGINNVDNIYVLTMASEFDQGKYTPYLSREILGQSIYSSPTVIAGGAAELLNKDNGTVPVFILDGEEEKEHQAVVSDFTLSALDVFSFEFTSGNKNQLGQPGTIAISEEMAERLELGIGDVISLKAGQKDPATVVCVFKNFPKASDLGEIDAVKCSYFEQPKVAAWRRWDYTHFIRLDSPESVKDFQTSASKAIRDLWWNHYELESLSDEEKEEHFKSRDIHLAAFKDLYFSKEPVKPVGKIGNPVTTATLFILCIVVLLITVTNFINSIFAQVPQRIKSVNTQKIMGASRQEIVLKFLSEAAILVIISLAFAGTIVHLFQGSNIANFVSKEVGFSENMAVIFLTVFSALGVTVIAGVYPARYITSFPPAFALKGMTNVSKTGMGLRYILQCIQFTVSIVLIICTLFLIKQNSYMINYDMGFNSGNLYTAKIPASVAKNNIEDFQAQLLSYPEIEDAAWSYGSFVSVSKMMESDEVDGNRIQFDILPVSWNFLDFMGIGIVEGRGFEKSDENSVDGLYVFNQKAMEELGIGLDNKIIGHRNWTDVVGFCENSQYKPLQYGVEPLGFYVFGKYPWTPMDQLYVRAHEGTDVKKVMDLIEETAKAFDTDPNRKPVEVQYYKESMETLYNKEIQFSRLIALFAFIAICISLLGVVGLVMYESLSKIKEISVRRVLGADIGSILKMFNIRFIKIITVCFIVAAPVSYYIIDGYLNTFAYRIPLYWWIFAGTYVAVLFISNMIVTLSCAKAARTNPVKGLRVDN